MQENLTLKNNYVKRGSVDKIVLFLLEEVTGMF